METSFYKMIAIFKKHYTALVLVILFGILMILPFFYFQIKLGGEFKGILTEIVNDENFYYARIKDVIDGHPFLSNAYLTEHKDGLPQQVFLAEWLLAQPIKWFGWNINEAHLIYNFLFPAIAFILTYLALYLISKSRFWSITFSAFLFFGLYLLAFIRPVSPQFNFIFWLTQFIFLWLLINSHDNANTANPVANDANREYKNSLAIRSISKENTFALLCANAINFGLLFYIYPYYWTFYLIFFVIFLAFNFINSKYSHNPNYGSKSIFLIIAGGLVLAIPYFYLNYLASKLPYYLETLTRLGMIYTRFPSGIRTVFLSAVGLISLGVFLYTKIVQLDAKTIFWGSGLLTSILAVNQHLITGKNFEFSSHYDMAAVFFLVFALAYLLSHLNPNKSDYNPNIPNNRKFGLFGYIRIFGLLIVAIVIISNLSNYLKRSLVIYENHVYRQNYAPVFDWLNKNTPKDSIVYANPEISGLIPVYTANNVYFVREANLFFISDEEVLGRFILNNFFEKFDENFIIQNIRSIYGVRYIDAYGHAVQGNKLRRILGMKLEPEIYLPEEAIQKVIARAEKLKKSNFVKEITKYRVDYLIWDKNKNPQWKIGKNYFETVFQIGDFSVYRIR